MSTCCLSKLFKINTSPKWTELKEIDSKDTLKKTKTPLESIINGKTDAKELKTLERRVNAHSEKVTKSDDAEIKEIYTQCLALIRLGPPCCSSPTTTWHRVAE